MNYREAKIRADVLKALGHPVRVLIVDALREEDRYVSELNRAVPIAQSNMTRHLQVLKKCGIVTEKRVGSRVYHHLQTPHVLETFNLAETVVRIDKRRKDDYLKSVAPA